MRGRTAFALLTLLGMWGGVANARDTATLDIRENRRASVCTDRRATSP
jgi:hypothetical protein